MGDLLGRCRCRDHLPDRGRQAVAPLGGILLGPAAGRMGHRAATTGGCDLATFGIDQQGLDFCEPMSAPIK